MVDSSKITSRQRTVLLRGLVVVILVIAAFFCMISFSYLSTDWVTNPDFFRGDSARGGFSFIIFGTVAIYSAWSYAYLKGKF